MARLRQGFDGPIKLEFHGAKITSDEGSLVYQELDDAFISTASATGHRADVRTVNYTQPARSLRRSQRRRKVARGHRLVWPEVIMSDLECRGSCIVISVLS